MWKKINDNSISGIVFQDLGDGEKVEVIDITAPLDVTSLYSANFEKTSVDLIWTESASVDADHYDIYNGATKITTVSATPSKQQPLRYTVVGLTAATNYSFTIKTIDGWNNESNGTTITTRTLGNYALSMNGTSSYVKTTSNFTFDEIEIVMNIDATNNGTIFDARNGFGQGYMILSSGQLGYGNDLVDTPYYNDTHKVPRNLASTMPTGTKLRLNAKFISAKSDDVNIFSGTTGTSNLKGLLYTVKFYNSGSLIANFNFTEQIGGSTIADPNNASYVATIFNCTQTLV